MRARWTTHVTAIAALGLIAAAPPPDAPDSVPVPLDSIVTNHAELQSMPRGAGRVHAPLNVTFLPADWPNLTVKASKPWDWSPYGRLFLEVQNPGTQRVAFGVRVDDDPGADGTLHCRTAESSIGPGETAVFAVELTGDPMAHGMRGLPGQAGLRSVEATGKGPFDLRHIVAWQIYLDQPKTPRTLVLSRLRLAPRPSLVGIVDRFGQYARAEWPGKVHDQTSLTARRAAELADLKVHPALADRDRYGGWLAGPERRRSGYFRAEKVDGKWWLVDPDGRLFFSTGIDEVRPDLPTFVERRETMFSWLPPGPTDPLARFLGSTDVVHSGPIKSGRTFDFYGANLARKYGAGYVAAWKDITLRRLPSWGFNTLGNWSDRFYRNGRVPYVAYGGIRGNHARVSSGSDYWGKMHDPFDPRFAASVERSLREVASEVKGDPFCLGYFVDNELSWGDSDPSDDAGRYGLALGTLEESSASPAKAALLAQLQKKYGDIARLNAAWKTTFPGWRDLQSSWRPPLPLADGLRADLAEFTIEFARRYFRTVRDQLRKFDPDHLYLGCRFARFTPESVKAAAELCDLVSFNIYDTRVDPARWRFLNELDHPCLIGEFHVGALDRGMFHTGLVAAADQAERASIFTSYVRSVLDHPAFVGCHWFQYVDEPLTGRTFDGENYAIGFVSVTDTPYPELVSAARAVHAEAYPRRFGTKPPQPARRAQ